MHNYSIRGFEIQDYEKLLDLWNGLGLGGVERGDNLDVIQRTIKNDGALFVLLTEDGEMIGSAWLTNDSRRIYLHHFGIRKDYQNKRLGLLLTNHCIEWGRKKNMQLKLEVHDQNQHAMRLYEKAGFKRLGDYDVFIIRDYEEL